MGGRRTFGARRRRGRRRWFRGGGEVGVGEAAGGGTVLDDDVGCGGDDAVFEALELYLELDAVELEGGKTESLSGMLGEPEWEWNVEHACAAGVADELHASVALPHHFGEALACLTGELLPHEEEVAVEAIDGAATNYDGGALDQELTDGIRPACPLLLLPALVYTHAITKTGGGGGARRWNSAAPILVLLPPLLTLQQTVCHCLSVARVWNLVSAEVMRIHIGISLLRRVVAVGELVTPHLTPTILSAVLTRSDTRNLNKHVHVVHQVTCTVKGNLSSLTKSDSTVKRLDHSLHRKVSITKMTHLPVSKLRVLGQVRIHGTNSD